MFDYFMSKMVWIVAAVFLTASVVGVYTWQRRSLEELVLEEQADSISDILNCLMTTEGEFKGLVSFNSSRPSAFYLDPTVNGEAYSINFTSTGLSMHQGSAVSWVNFVGQLHLYDPLFMESIRVDFLDVMAGEIDHVIIHSGEDFFVESRIFQGVRYVFLYAEGDNEVIEYTRHLGDKISDLLEYSFTGDLDDVDAKLSIELSYPVVFLNNIFYIRETAVQPYPLPYIRLWPPEADEYDRDEMESLDIHRLNAVKGDTITVERRMLRVDGEYMIQRFIYI